MKKTLLIIGIFIVVTFCVAVFVVPLFLMREVKPPQELLANKGCPFCDPVIIEKQQYYEGQLIRVLYNHFPLSEGDTLIIPKRQVERFENLTLPESIEMLTTINKVQKAFEKVYHTSDYVLVLQNGKLAGQTVNHTHIHMIPRSQESYLKKLSRKVDIWLTILSRSTFGQPLTNAELQKQKAPLQEAMLDQQIE